MHLNLTLSAAAAALVAVSSAHAVETITLWNFQETVSAVVVGTAAPAVGTGTVTPVGGVTTTGFNSGAGSSDPLQPGFGYQSTTYPAQSTASASAGVQFAVPTTGFENLTVQFDLRSSNTSSRWFQVQASNDGLTFVNVGTPSQLRPGEDTAGDLWTNNITADLTGVAGVDDNAAFAFRVVSAFSPVGFTQVNTGQTFAANTAYEAARNNPLGTSSNYAGGTWRFDMVEVSGTLIPEPAGLGLLALGGLALVRRRRA